MNQSRLESKISGNFYQQNVTENPHSSMQTAASICEFEKLCDTYDTSISEKMNIDLPFTSGTSGIKVKKGRALLLSRQQRRRHRKGIEKAEVSCAKLDKKRKDSYRKAKSIKNRRVWPKSVLRLRILMSI